MVKENKDTNKEEKKQEKIIFCRKDLRPGIYTVTAYGKTIQIKDRAVYETDKTELINFFNEDPEIIIFKEKEKTKKKK